MNRSTLFNNIVQKKSCLCIGLDTDLDKIPSFLKNYDDPILEFNKRIIDATKDLCVAYKPNTAFYESYGSKGWESLEKTIEYIPNDIFIIADAKRGDIGNTSARYAKAFFQGLKADAVTVAPYMGSDSVEPFLGFENKWVVLLALTSNKGSSNFQRLEYEGKCLFDKVLEVSSKWGSADQLMYVVGATHPEAFENIRQIVQDHFLLVPGVGAQGGNLEEVLKYGMNTHCGLLINSSRGIIYAGNDENFAQASREAAIKIQRVMDSYITNLL